MTIPKKLTATNDVTGALIKSKGDNRDVYASGWDAIWGKKQKEVLDAPDINLFGGVAGGGMSQLAQGGFVPEMPPIVIGQSNLEEGEQPIHTGDFSAHLINNVRMSSEFYEKLGEVILKHLKDKGNISPAINLNTTVDTNPPADDENVSKDVLRGHNEH